MCCKLIADNCVFGVYKKTEDFEGKVQTHYSSALQFDLAVSCADNGCLSIYFSKSVVDFFFLLKLKFIDAH